ncbi:hypothetical protein BFRIG_00866 [Peribacillus frigoritolerans]
MYYQGPSNYLDGYLVYLSIHFKHVIVIKWHVAGNYKPNIKILIYLHYKQREVA